MGYYIMIKVGHPFVEEKTCRSSWSARMAIPIPQVTLRGSVVASTGALGMPGCFRPNPKAFARAGKMIIITALHQWYVAGSTSREKKN